MGECSAAEPEQKYPAASNERFRSIATSVFPVRIGEKSPLALKLSRIAIDQGLHASFEQTLELEAGHLLACVSAQNQSRFVDLKLQKMKQKP